MLYFDSESTKSKELLHLTNLFLDFDKVNCHHGGLIRHCHSVNAIFLPALCLLDWFHHKHLTLSLGYFV